VAAAATIIAPHNGNASYDDGHPSTGVFFQKKYVCLLAFNDDNNDDGYHHHSRHHSTT